MAFLIVVKRDEPELFAYLRQHFQEPDVTVVMDRRYGERRRIETMVAEDRRRGSRRALAAEDDPLWRYGFRVAVVQTPSAS